MPSHYSGLTMAKLLPTNIKVMVEESCFKILDDWKYLHRTRVENSKFMDRLVEHRDVGKKLQEFLDKAAVRKYIKDVLVNKYAKQVRKMPRDISGILAGIVDDEIQEIDWVANDNLSLHRTSRDVYVVSARTTFVKWETGLRKILLYVADKPVLRRRSDDEVIRVLVVFEHSMDVNDADRNMLQTAMQLTGIQVAWGT